VFGRPILHKFLRFSAISHPQRKSTAIKSDTTTHFHTTAGSASYASDADSYPYVLKPEERTPSRSMYYVLVEKGFGVRRGKKKERETVYGYHQGLGGQALSLRPITYRES